MGIESQDVHPKGVGQFAHSTADPAEADDTDGLALEFDKWRFPEGPIRSGHPLAGFDGLIMMPYAVAEFQAAGTEMLEEIEVDGLNVVIAGGSGLHFRSLVDPLEFPPTDVALRSELEAMTATALRDELVAADPAAGAVVDLANPRRVLRAVEILRLTGATPSERSASEEAEAIRSYRPIRPFSAIGIDPGSIIRGRIEQRFDQMLAAGLVEEVAALAPRLGRTARQAVGYRELLAVVEGDERLASARVEAIRATSSLAKRQRTYFGRDPRIRWIPWHHEASEMLAGALEALAKDAEWTS
jgi:tRNA dimethylallyltransferase